MNLFRSLVILLILLVDVIYCRKEPQKCCQNEKNLLIDRRCAPNKTGKSPSIILECEEKYILNPYDMEEDQYNVTENGTLFIPDMENFLFYDE